LIQSQPSSAQIAIFTEDLYSPIHALCDEGFAAEALSLIAMLKPKEQIQILSRELGILARHGQTDEVMSLVAQQDPSACQEIFKFGIEYLFDTGQIMKIMDFIKDQELSVQAEILTARFSDNVGKGSKLLQILSLQTKELQAEILSKYNIIRDLSSGYLKYLEEFIEQQTAEGLAKILSNEPTIRELSILERRRNLISFIEQYSQEEQVKILATDHVISSLLSEYNYEEKIISFIDNQTPKDQLKILSAKEASEYLFLGNPQKITQLIETQNLAEQTKILESLSEMDIRHNNSAKEAFALLKQKHEEKQSKTLLQGRTVVKRRIDSIEP
jgi:hypothetical protein